MKYSASVFQRHIHSDQFLKSARTLYPVSFFPSFFLRILPYSHIPDKIKIVVVVGKIVIFPTGQIMAR
jgi:hypothetical protein